MSAFLRAIQSIGALCAFAGLLWVASLVEAQNAPTDPATAPALSVDELTQAELDQELYENLSELIGSTIDIQAWLDLADRAEQVIDRDQASNEAIEVLRAELADYRSRFAGIRDDNSARIRTLRQQIDRLGPIPETGTEAEPVTLTRAALMRRLDLLTAPSVAAEAAFGRADGLIAEIDALQRSRDAEAFLRRGPSPLNPAHWPSALGDLSRFMVSLGAEFTEALSNRNTREMARQRAPQILLMLLFGLYCLLRGRGLAQRFGAYMRGFGGHGSGVWDFVMSIARIAIPYAGVVLIINAIHLSTFPGLRTEALLDALPNWALTLLVVTWLRDQLFSQAAIDEGKNLAPPEKFPAVMLMVSALAIMLVVASVLATIIGVERLSADSAAVLWFPVLVLTSLFLFRLAMIVRPRPRSGEAEAVVDEATPRAMGGSGPILPGLCWLARIIAVLAPLAAALGFGEAALRTVFPMVWTLALFGGVVAVHALLSKFYAWAVGADGTATESFILALAGVLLVLSVMPVVAIIWGVRDSDLLELWTRFLEGVQVGETRISPLDFLTFLVIFALGYGATRVLQSALRNNLLPKTRIDQGGQTAIVSGTGYVGIFLAALIAISAAGLNLSSLAIVAGALSVGIGFGLQTIVSNFVSGIILLIERPVSEGDWIEVGGFSGIVKNISVRATRIETFDRMDVIVPNSDLISGAVTNYTHNPAGRVIIPVGVAYGTDTKRVEAILQEIGNDHPMAMARPAPFVVFKGFGADSLDFELRVIIRDVNWGLTVRSELNHAIAERFAAENIEIPFAQRDLWLRNPEALSPTSAPEAQPKGDQIA